MSEPMTRSRGALPASPVRPPGQRVAAIAVVTVVAGAGFLSSFALLRAGLHGMGLRYAASAALAYLVLLGLLRAWVALAPPAPAGPARPERVRGPDDRWEPRSHSRLDRLGDVDPFSALDLDLDAAAVAVIGIVLAALGVVVGVVFVLSNVPGLLTEIVLDGAIAAGLYRRARRGVPGAWWAGAVRRTLAPALLVVALLGAGGLLIQGAVPCADSIRQVWSGSGIRACPPEAAPPPPGSSSSSRR